MVRHIEKKSKVAAILNKYKDSLNNLINISDTESPDQTKASNWLELIDKGIYNTYRSEIALLNFLEENSLDKDMLVTLLKLAPQIGDFQIYKHHDIVLFGLKSEKIQDGEDQKS